MARYSHILFSDTPLGYEDIDYRLRPYTYYSWPYKYHPELVLRDITKDCLESFNEPVRAFKTEQGELLEVTEESLRNDNKSFVEAHTDRQLKMIEGYMKDPQGFFDNLVTISRSQLPEHSHARGFLDWIEEQYYLLPKNHPDVTMQGFVETEGDTVIAVKEWGPKILKMDSWTQREVPPWTLKQGTTALTAKASDIDFAKMIQENIDEFSEMIQDIALDLEAAGIASSQIKSREDLTSLHKEQVFQLARKHHLMLYVQDIVLALIRKDTEILEQYSKDCVYSYSFLHEGEWVERDESLDWFESYHQHANKFREVIQNNPNIWMTRVECRI